MKAKKSASKYCGNNISRRSAADILYLELNHFKYSISFRLLQCTKFINIVVLKRRPAVGRERMIYGELNEQEYAVGSFVYAQSISGLWPVGDSFGEKTRG